MCKAENILMVWNLSQAYRFNTRSESAVGTEKNSLGIYVVLYNASVGNYDN